MWETKPFGCLETNVQTYDDNMIRKEFVYFTSKNYRVRVVNLFSDH